MGQQLTTKSEWICDSTTTYSRKQIQGETRLWDFNYKYRSFFQLKAHSARYFGSLLVADTLQKCHFLFWVSAFVSGGMSSGYEISVARL